MNQTSSGAGPCPAVKVRHAPLEGAGVVDAVPAVEDQDLEGARTRPPQ